MLAQANDKWVLVSCVVQAFSPEAPLPEAIGSRAYEHVVLHESFLSHFECEGFVRELQGRRIALDSIGVEAQGTPGWQIEPLPSENRYVREAGLVIEMVWNASGGFPQPPALLAPGQPYYPTLEDAVRHWMPFREPYSGSDSRFGRVCFVLPEARAYIGSLFQTASGKLKVSVRGNDRLKGGLLINGASWTAGTINHFETPVDGGLSVVDVPVNAERLELFLIDNFGALYDFHKEERRFARGGQKQVLRALGPAGLKERVRQAVVTGEGRKIEFKPFIDLSKARLSDKKSKFSEILRTVVAFANTDGGCIYLGVDDDGSLPGIEQELQQATGMSPARAIKSYLGTLKSKVLELVRGDVVIDLNSEVIDDHLICELYVYPVTVKPVSLRQDAHLYARVGASNQKVPPEMWKEVIEPFQSGFNI